VTVTVDFCANNLRVARLFRGLTQRDLAEQVAVSEATIWQLERERSPGDSVLAALGDVLGFDEAFFFSPLQDEILEEECNFRSGLAAALKTRRRVLARGSLFGCVVRYLGEVLELPEYRVPSIEAKTAEEIESAAAQCRRQWGLGDNGPILSMGRVLENAGVMVTMLDAESAKLDAFSRCKQQGGMCIVALNTHKGSTSRTRFDMAHELGHLVLHQATKSPLKEREKQADQFASSFLLPNAGFAREFWAAGGLNWMGLLELKERWRVSLAALIYRARELNLVGEAEYRRAYKGLSIRGWRRHEPEEPPFERPELFLKAMRTLWEKKGVGVPGVAADLHWHVKTFEDVTGMHSPKGEGLSRERSVLSLVQEAKKRKRKPQVAGHDLG
jgi:Zn-dependent peptidase ImmA (M78 family)